jgi:Pup amidohydrolase
MTPKLCGADMELGNFILGTGDDQRTGAAAAQTLVREFDGCTACAASSVAASESPPGGASSRDWARIYLRNGGCAYIDSDHLELATAETQDAFDQTACVYAMFRLTQQALARANAKQPAGRTVHALANNSDGCGHSYGSHTNFLLSRPAWEEIFRRRLRLMLYLGSFQVSSIAWSGQGKVGSENGRPAATFQLSQRADFIETATPSPQTMSCRPLCNSRDESLCGAPSNSRQERARLHVIFFDHTLCHASTILKFGAMQVVLAMIESGSVNRALILDDPIDALTRWSRDPAFRTTAALDDGRQVTALDLQWRFYEDARRFVQQGGCDGLVPRADDVLALWERILSGLERDPDSLVGCVDWILKRSILNRALGRDPAPTMAALKHLDHQYSSLDPNEGLYWLYERGGLVDRLVADDRIEWFTAFPPEDSRAWTRGRLLGHPQARAIVDVGWDRVVVRSAARRGGFISRTVHLGDPLEWTRRDAEPYFATGDSLEGILDRIEASRPDAVARSTDVRYGAHWTALAANTGNRRTWQ